MSALWMDSGVQAIDGSKQSQISQNMCGTPSEQDARGTNEVARASRTCSVVGVLVG